MNTELLRSPEYESNGMFASEFTKNRPEDEDQIDAWFDELVGIWDALFKAIPELHKDPSFMRTNNADEEDAKAEGHENNALFRPIVQEGILAKAARMLLNRANTNTNAGMVKALENLSLINWDLYSAPWIHCLIIKNENDKWVIASEERSKRIDIILEVVLWLVGFLSLEDDEVSEMKETYQTYLKCNEETQDSLWKEIEATYKKING